MATEQHDPRGTLTLYRALRRDLLVTINDMQWFRGRDRIPSAAARAVRDKTAVYCRHYARVARRVKCVRGMLS